MCPFLLLKGGLILADNTSEFYNSIANFDFVGFEKKIDSIKKKTDEAAKALGENFKYGMDMASTAMKSFDNLSPGFLGVLGDIINTVSTTGEGLLGMSSSLAKGFSIVGTAIDIGLSLINFAIGQAQKAEEKRQQIFEEGIQKSSEYAKETSVLETNIKILENDKSSTEEVTAAKTELINSFPDLITGWDDESQAILGNHELLKNYLADTKELEEVNLKKAAKSFNADENVSKYNSEIEQLDALKKALKSTKQTRKDYLSDYGNAKYGYTSVLSDTGIFEWTDEDINEKIIEITESLLNLKTESKKGFDALVKSLIEIQDETGLVSTWKDLDNTQRNIANTYLYSSEVLDKLRVGQLTAADAAAELNQILSDPAEMEEYLALMQDTTTKTEEKVRIDRILAEEFDGQKASIKELKDSYQKLTEQQALSDDELRRLITTYPELHDYLEKTNDLTLNNGQAIAEAMGNLNYAEELTQIEELQSAYEQLASGKQLDLSTTYELCQKYPELADYLSTHKDLTFENGQKILEVRDSYREAAKGIIQSNLDIMTSNLEATEDSIKKCQDLVNLYNAYAVDPGRSQEERNYYDKESDKQWERFSDLVKSRAELSDSIKKSQALLNALENPPPTKSAGSGSSPPQSLSLIHI